MEMGRSVVKFVTDYNTAVENGIRLSTYVEARKAGISEARAASLAKNLTVNLTAKASGVRLSTLVYVLQCCDTGTGPVWENNVSDCYRQGRRALPAS